MHVTPMAIASYRATHAATRYCEELEMQSARISPGRPCSALALTTRDDDGRSPSTAGGVGKEGARFLSFLKLFKMVINSDPTDLLSLKMTFNFLHTFRSWLRLL